VESIKYKTEKVDREFLTNRARTSLRTKVVPE